jgi:hypothetical protein
MERGRATAVQHHLARSTVAEQKNRPADEALAAAASLQCTDIAGAVLA